MIREFWGFYLYARSLPKSLYINFKYLNFYEALKIPILVSHRVKLKSLKGKLQLKNKNLSIGTIKIGFGDVLIFDQNRSRIILEVNGTINFHGTGNIGHGSKLSVSELATVSFGNNFVMTLNL